MASLIFCFFFLYSFYYFFSLYWGANVLQSPVCTYIFSISYTFYWYFVYNILLKTECFVSSAAPLHVKIFTPNVMLLGRGVSGREWSWSLSQLGLVHLGKTSKSSAASSVMGGVNLKTAVYKPGSWCLIVHLLCRHSELGLPRTSVVRNKFLLFIRYPVCDILFWQST